MTPRINFRTDYSGVPIVSKKDLDHLGEEIIGDFCAEAVIEPMAIDIERFIQSYLGLEQDFQHLSSNGVYLGMTVFNDTNKVPVYDPETGRAEYISAKAGTVLIDHRLLEENQGNRYRFTLAHESSHTILHASSFTYNPDQTCLFEVEDIPMIRCRMAELAYGPRKPVSQWTAKDRVEWQANRLSSAILMPKKMVDKLVSDRNREPPHSEEGTSPARTLCQSLETVSLVSETFKVSKEAAIYRLQDLNLIPRNTDKAVLCGTRDFLDVIVD